MVGVNITVGTISGPAAPGRAPGSTYFVVGQAERGPSDRAVLLQSFADYQATYGDATTYGALYDDVRTFFEEGGDRCYVARAVGAAATTGALASPLMDRAGTPIATLAIAAVSPGAWSSRISVKVLDGSTSGTFRLQVFLDGVLVEDYAGLSSPAMAASRLNDGATASKYVRLTNAGSATVAPNNNPAVTASPVVLSAGTDDRASIVTAGYVTALNLFTDGLGDGAVAIPGMGSAVHAGLVAHANAYGRIALLSSERSSDKATLIGQAAALDCARAGLFGPWVKVPDPLGGTKVIAPDGYVAACRARAHNQAGPWQAAAGEVAIARRVLAPDQAFTPADANDLDAAKVNIIRTIAATTRLYGWRSTAVDQVNWKMLNYADVINRIVNLCRALAEPYVFKAIDGKGQLLAGLAGTLEGIVKPIADAGGLFPWYVNTPTGPRQSDPGYKIVTGSTLNSTVSLSGDEIRAMVNVRPAPTAATVSISVNKASVTAAL